MDRAPPRPPPELNDDATVEILLRVAPDEPASLFRASAVCKLWHRILSDPDFCRRYRSFHRGAPLLGFFYNLDFPAGPFSGFNDDPAPLSRFVAATAASPLPHAAAAQDDDRRVSLALDCRHGRVLFQTVRTSLVVWDPIADDRTNLPPLGIHYTSYSAVVLCDVAGCDHRDCRGGRYLVVCVGLRDFYDVVACVYSSKYHAWRAPVSDSSHWLFHISTPALIGSRPALIGNEIYCTFNDCDGILKYDVVQCSFSLIDMPCKYSGQSQPAVLMQNEDGSLGLADLRGSRLYLWSRRLANPEEGDDEGWVQLRVIKLPKLLPHQANVIGFAEGIGVFFIWTNVGVFTFDLKSRRVMKVSKPKNLHKFFNKVDIPWVNLIWEKYYNNGKLPSHIKKGSFWWKDVLKLLDKFKGLASVVPEAGDTCLLWDDLWLGRVPKLEFPELYSFTRTPLQTLQQAKMNTDLIQTFHLPLSVEAFDQFTLLQQALQDFQLTQNADCWVYIWGSKNYSCRRAYRHLAGSAGAHPVFKWIWKSCCQHNHKVFFWLLVRDRLSTRNLLRRKNMFLPSYCCVMCDHSVEEEVGHLFLHCPLAKASWEWLGLVLPQLQDPFLILEDFKLQLRLPFFMEIVIVMCWSIWKVRNDLIFKGEAASLQKCKVLFRKFFGLVILCAKKRYLPTILLWLEQLV